MPGVLERLKNLGLAISVCVGLTWLLDRDPPHDYGSVTALSAGHYRSGRAVPPARAGGTLAVRYELTRERLCPMRIERTITDSEGAMFILSEERYTPTELGEFVTVRHLPIDVLAMSGPATAKIDLFWFCNPLHYIPGNAIRTTVAVPFMIAETPSR